MKNCTVFGRGMGIYILTLDQRALPVTRIAEALVQFRRRRPVLRVTAMHETTGAGGCPMLVVVTDLPYAREDG
ncbi:MAG TPA: hypothetical protein VJJ02_00175 [Candidatus Paceibacterota bacterium]